MTGPPTAEVARTLAAKARQHGTVLIPTPAGRPGYDLHLDVTGQTWEGLGKGRGRLRRQKIDVIAAGRGAAARPKRARLAMPLPPQPSSTVDAITESDEPATVLAQLSRATA